MSSPAALRAALPALDPARAARAGSALADLLDDVLDPARLAPLGPDPEQVRTALGACVIAAYFHSLTTAGEPPRHA